MKTHMYGSIPSLTSALDMVGGHRHAPAALPPGMKPGTHCIGGWVGPRAVLELCGKPRLHRDLIPEPSSPYRVAVPTELSRRTKTLRNTLTGVESRILNITE
jgi:hypothetical protein